MVCAIDGAVAFYDLNENEHAGGILSRTTLPAAVSDQTIIGAQTAAQKVLEAFDYVGVLTIEFKINLLAPAQGESFRMVGKVVKPGRTVTVAEGHAYALHQGQEKLVATTGCTLMAVVGRDNVRG